MRRNLNQMSFIVKKIRKYQGAGCLLYRISNKSKIEVFLGLRKYSPFKNYWSIPGGESNRSSAGKYNESQCQSALRETEEETGLKLEKSLENIKTTHLYIPGLFSYRTYIIHLKGNPNIFKNHEFSEIGWFEINNLPQPIHIGLKSAVNKINW